MRGLFRKGLAALTADQRGATAVEYGLIVALIMLAMIGAMSTIGNQATGMWAGIRDKLATAR